MKHKLLKLSAVLLLGLGITPLQGQTTMNVKTVNGTQTSYTLSTIRKLTFTDTGNMAITKTTASTADNYVLTSVRYLKSGDQQAGIEPTIDNANSAHLRLYPNPVVDLLSIQLPATIQTASVELLSIEGKILYKKQLITNNLLQINVSQFRQGIYLCRVNNGTSIKTTKFIKQ